MTLSPRVLGMLAIVLLAAAAVPVVGLAAPAGPPVRIGGSLAAPAGPPVRIGGSLALTGPLAAGVAVAVLAYERGASMFRVHDVREHVEALTAARAVVETP